MSSPFILAGYIAKLKSNPTKFSSPWATRYFVIEDRPSYGRNSLLFSYYSTRNDADDVKLVREECQLSKISFVGVLGNSARLEYYKMSSSLPEKIKKELIEYSARIVEVETPSRVFFLRAESEELAWKWCLSLQIVGGIPLTSEWKRSWHVVPPATNDEVLRARKAVGTLSDRFFPSLMRCVPSRYVKYVVRSAIVKELSPTSFQTPAATPTASPVQSHLMPPSEPEDVYELTINNTIPSVSPPRLKLPQSELPPLYQNRHSDSGSSSSSDSARAPSPLVGISLSSSSAHRRRSSIIGQSVEAETIRTTAVAIDRLQQLGSETALAPLAAGTTSSTELTSRVKMGRDGVISTYNSNCPSLETTPRASSVPEKTFSTLSQQGFTAPSVAIPPPAPATHPNPAVPPAVAPPTLTGASQPLRKDVLPTHRPPRSSPEEIQMEGDSLKMPPVTQRVRPASTAQKLLDLEPESSWVVSEAKTGHDTSLPSPVSTSSNTNSSSNYNNLSPTDSSPDLLAVLSSTRALPRTSSAALALQRGLAAAASMQNTPAPGKPLSAASTPSLGPASAHGAKSSRASVLDSEEDEEDVFLVSNLRPPASHGTESSTTTSSGSGSSLVGRGFDAMGLLGSGNGSRQSPKEISTSTSSNTSVLGTSAPVDCPPLNQNSRRFESKEADFSDEEVAKEDR